jgi:hypothetical protein
VGIDDVRGIGGKRSTEILNNLQLRCQVMDSHRLTDGEVLVAQVNRRRSAKRAGHQHWP